jgi:hypothetical protein
MEKELEEKIKKLEKEKEKAQLKDEYLKCLRLGDKLENLKAQLKRSPAKGLVKTPYKKKLKWKQKKLF